MDINFWDIGWHMLSIVLLTLLFKRYLFKPVRNFMETRAKVFADERTEIDAQKQELQQQQSELEQSRASLQQQGAEIVAHSQQQGEEQAQEIVDQAHTQAAAIVAEAQKQAAQLKQSALGEARDQVADLSVEIASRILEREVNKEDHAHMVEEFIKEVSAS